MTTPKAKPNEITNSYLEEEFKRIFGRPAGGFPEGVVSNADKMKHIAEAHKKIEEEEAALEREASQNLAKLDAQAKELGLFKDSEGKAPAEIAQKVDNGNASKGAKASDLLNNSDNNQTRWEEARAERQKAFVQKRKAFAKVVQKNLEVLNKQREELAQAKKDFAGRVYTQLGTLNAKLETLNKKENLTPDEKASAEEIRHRIEKLEKKAHDLGLLDNPAKNAPVAQEKPEKDNTTSAKTNVPSPVAQKVDNAAGNDNLPEKNQAQGNKALATLKENHAKNLDQANRNIEMVNQKIAVLFPKKEALAEEAHQNPARPNKQQAQAPDLLKNSGKTESQESSKEGKGLLSRAFHFVQRMFRNVLAEVINAYRAENKDDHKVFVQRDSGYNTSFVRINKQEFNLEPGKDFNRKYTGINICITYKNNDLTQQQQASGALPQQASSALMNIKINDTEYNIEPGQSAKHKEHGVEVEVVHVRQQGMDINQSQEVAGKDVKNIKEAKVLQALGPNNALEGVKAQPVSQEGITKPSQTPTETEKKGGEFCMRL